MIPRRARLFPTERFRPGGSGEAPPGTASWTASGAGLLAGALLAAAALATPASVRGQEAAGDGGSRVAVRVDVEALYGSVAVAWPAAGGWRAGVQLGGGLLHQVWLLPQDEDPLSVLHLAAILSRETGPRTAVEIGIRAEAAEHLEECSGCLPTTRAGAILAVYWGGEKVRGGSRVFLGGQEGRVAMSWSPVLLRLRF